MATPILPPLAGRGWSVKRSPQWKTRVQESISGKRTRIAAWSYPRWQWELSFELLRQAGTNQQAPSFAGATWSEFAQLAGFFNSLSGRQGVFLFTDPDDNTATGQGIGLGDGSSVAFPLVRSFGGYSEPIFAVNAMTSLTVNGVSKVLGTDYDVVTWDGLNLSAGNPNVAAPGTLFFGSAPASGATIVATFSFFWPCEFEEDSLGFEKFMAALYQAKSVKFSSLK